LPAALAQFVTEGSKAIGCPADYLGVPMLVLAGAAVGASRCIELKEGWKESPTLYAAVVGGPGTTKTPALKAVKAPFEARELELGKRFRGEYREYKERSELFEQQRKVRKKQPEQAESAETTTLEVELDKPLPPVQRRCLTNDATTEAMAILLSENPQGIALVRDELVAWTRSMNMYRKGKGTDREFYLSAWSSSAIRIDRKMNREAGPIAIPHPLLSVVGCMTPDMLGELAEEEGRSDGFVDRILFAYPDPQPPARWCKESVISAESRRMWVQALAGLWALSDGHPVAQPDPSPLSLDNEAEQAWAEFFNESGEELIVDGPFTGTWSKMRGICARLALILQMLRWACGEAEADSIDGESLQRAVTLVYYFASHANRVYAAMRDQADESTPGSASASSIERLLAGTAEMWTGTASELLPELRPYMDAEDCRRATLTKRCRSLKTPQDHRVPAQAATRGRSGILEVTGSGQDTPDHTPKTVRAVRSARRPA
jgi:hypothetical protein